jgi:dynactin-5
MFFPEERPYKESDYITTSTGIIASRSAVRNGHIEIPGGKCIIESGVVLHGDIAPVKLDRYVIIDESSVLRPPQVSADKFAPMSIGKYVYIGKNCTVESAVIGVGVSIGNNCTLLPRCILKDFVQVEEGTVVPPDMVIPPFAIVSGAPAKIVGERPASVSTTTSSDAMMRYRIYRRIS